MNHGRSVAGSDLHCSVGPDTHRTTTLTKRKGSLFSNLCVLHTSKAMLACFNNPFPGFLFPDTISDLH